MSVSCQEASFTETEKKKERHTDAASNYIGKGHEKKKKAWTTILP